MKNFRSIKSTGFGSKIENEGERLLNKDGSFNIEKGGLHWRTQFSLFHSLINMPLWKFMLCLLMFFVVINSFFALLYVLLGVENLGLINQSEGMEFLNAFFFSAQTITTVGYGAIAPTGIGANIVATFEAFLGLIAFAMATGLLYGRFSRPRAKLIYSQNALIAPYLQDDKGLMLRLANARRSQMINVTAKVMLSRVEEKDGVRKRMFYQLDLEINQINLLATSWTLVHPITENSPLYNIGPEELRASDAELMIALEGYDETYSQQVHARTSYKHQEVIFNAKFAKILGRNNDGKATIALDRISEYDLLSDNESR